MRVVRAGWVVLGLALGACSDDEGDTTDGRGDATDAVQETAGDTAGDTAPDTNGEDSRPDETAVDTANDSAVDTATDSAVDTATDTAVDTATDTAVDTAIDTAADTTPDTAVDTDTSVGVTWADVHPVFASSCAPCHQGATPSGGHAIASANIDTAYAASQLDAKIAKCAGKKVGECALIRIRDGSMPATGECREPVQPKCPDLEEQDLIEAWIDGGMLR